MDTPERPDGPPPALPPAPLDRHLPRVAARAPAPAPADDDAPAPRAITPKLAWRAFRRHWWLLLALWAAASAALAAVAYAKIRPRYEARAMLVVDPGAQSLLAQRKATDVTSLETHVQLLTSPEVLGAALASPKVAAQPLVRAAIDPEAELRSEIKAAIIPNTQIILVSMATEVPHEAVAIVNGVIDAYMKAAEGWTDRQVKEQVRQLKGMEKKLVLDREAHRETLRRLSRQQIIDQFGGGRDDRVSLEEYKRYRAELSGLQIDLMQALGRLEVLRQHFRPAAARPVAVALQGDALRDAARRAFLADPEVAPVYQQRKAIQDRLAEARRVVRDPHADPAVRGLAGRDEALAGEIRRLWEAKRPTLEAQLARAPIEPEQKAEGAADVRLAEIQVAALKAQEGELKRRLETLAVETKAEGNEALEVQFTTADLQDAEAMLKVVRNNLGQLEYEQQGGNRVNQVAKAKFSAVPQNSRRTAVVAAVPVLVFGLVLGLFMAVEARAGRVADPDDLSARVRVEVLGVVPPLPAPAPGRGPRAAREEKRRVEEFVQSLDHLRVVLCSGRGDPDGRRCVLITSACGGEGKTTLAAQLAGRCANAGLLTVLVDADLRRPSLGELLEVPEGPGLSDVLEGEADPEAAMVVIGNAGGFHLLPAGTAGRDPARLLQGEALGRLVARLRATFDVVIIDAPPVLSVPDALLLGRWADGAVLAVRHDTSRYPLVERANRRLAAVGIPVLGAVVNGVRAMEASYGVYHYAAAGPEDDADPAA